LTIKEKYDKLEIPEKRENKARRWWNVKKKIIIYFVLFDYFYYPCLFRYI